MIRQTLKFALLLGLIAGFVAFLGADAFLGDDRLTRRVVPRILAMFIVGAVTTIWGDKEIGTMDRTSLRIIFVIIGILVMLVAVMWGGVLHDVRP